MRFLKYFLISIINLLIAALLTVVTQVGGIVYLLSWVSYLIIRKRITKRYWKLVTAISIFMGLYLITILFVMPPIARRYGRVPLPFTKKNHVQPLTIWTALLSRNYVKPELRSVTYSVATEMNKKYPGTVLNYMDAGFPFIDGFPLPPHISHNDGKKLDVAFYYTDKSTRKITDKTPSPIGYGGSEPPLKGEPDRPSICASQGHWIYSVMYKNISLSKEFTFDQARTKAMTKLFLNNKSVGKMFIEPHLKERWHLTSNKVRLHGCYSVRHDDHIHVQLY